MRNKLGFSISEHMQRVMNINGFYASIMKADKKKDDKDTGLPTGIPIPVLPVDYLKVKPDNWIGGMGSYVIPVDSEWGLWFNFSMNNMRRTSILNSVKGMNPITGQRVSGLKLEQYTDKCPVHDVALQHGKYCPECKFKWPEQNYLVDKYLDGFRTPDGSVRQFYFTEDMAKSIPELVIGKEDTVPAFGFCFYDLKESEDPVPPGERYKDKDPKDIMDSRYKCYTGYVGSMGVLYTDSCSTGTGSSNIYFDRENGNIDCREFSLPNSSTLSCSELKLSNSSIYSYLDSDSIPMSKGIDDTVSTIWDTPISKEGTDTSLTDVKERSSAEVGIGAGAKIKQNINRDRHSLSDWKDNPTGTIRLYFVFQEEFEKYVSMGLNDLEGTKEGFMDALPVVVYHE